MHRDVSEAQARSRAIELLELVDMPDPAARMDYYPHQLSGGQRQRAMIAQALACDPVLLIADEPTTALDVTVQAEILDLLRDLRARVDAAILLITHAMGVVADLADRIMVMKDGAVVESASATTLFNDPQHPTPVRCWPQSRIWAPAGCGSPTSSRHRNQPPRRGAVVPQRHHRVQVRAQKTFRAVDSVDLEVAAGEVVGLVGESGSGKSTLGKAAVGLVRLTSGTVTLAGTDITTLSQRACGSPARRSASYSRTRARR